MARSIAEIYNQMVTEKQNFSQLNALQPNIDESQTLLNDLTTTSKVAVWRLIFFVVAVGIWSLENIYDLHKEWIENRAKEITPGNTFWYAKKSKEYQDGDTLEWINDNYQYSNINQTLQIIKLVSVSEGGGKVLIKVAKMNGTQPEPLDTDELLRFIEYMKKVKFAGINVLIVSRSADLLKISYKIYYDPLIMKSDGSLISDNSFPVEDTINNFIKNLPFDGVFSITSLTDEIQKCKGVINPVFISGQTQQGIEPYNNLNDYYSPNAGYLKIDDNYPLNSTLTYIHV